MVLSPTSGSADRSPSTKLSRRMMDDVRRRLAAVLLLLKFLATLSRLVPAYTLGVDDDDDAAIAVNFTTIATSN